MVGHLKLLGFAVVLGVSASAFGATLSENFNSNTDLPGSGWEFLNNRTAPQNYGWSDATNLSGSAALGGVITRSSAPSNFYGVNVGSLDPDTTSFSASGTMFVKSGPGGSSGFYLGWFNGASSYGSGGDPANFAGIGFGDMRNAQAFIFSDTQGRDRSGVDPAQAFDTSFAWSMQWNPPPAGSSEKGQLVVTLPTGTQTVNYGGDLPHLNPFSHLGVFATSANGGSGEFYLDNLQFTSTVPEPASLGLLSLGALAALRRRRA